MFGKEVQVELISSVKMSDVTWRGESIDIWKDMEEKRSKIVITNMIMLEVGEAFSDRLNKAISGNCFPRRKSGVG